MADWQGNGGTTGSSDICNVSPSDQIGTLDNILNRLQALEAALAGLLGTNVEAAQLSDISNDLGWIFNVEYLGTDGWTQTPSGTLIPPSGWTGLSDLITLGQTTIYSGGSVPGVNPRLHLYGGYSSDIAVNGSVYVTLSYSPSPTANGRADVSNNGTSYFSPGTDPGGNYGWEILEDGIYRFEIDASIVNGTPATPTAGDYQIALRRRVSSYTTIGNSSGSVSGAITFGYLVLSLTAKFNAGDWANFYVRNFTNGKITVSFMHVVGIYLGAS